MSTHGVSIIEITSVLPHDNAERLEIVPVNGWQAVVKKGDFLPGDRAIFIEPDYTVPTSRSEFAFLAKEGRERHRLKAVRLRGKLSFGLLIPVPEYLANRELGTDVMSDLGIERYEPPVKLANSDELPFEQCPTVYASKFDVESLQRFPNILRSGEAVIVTEKLHGANARYLWVDGTFFMGSRTRWLKPGNRHPWSAAAASDHRVQDWCRRNPGTVLYGEVYGDVQSLKYGLKQGQVRFAAFAASQAGQWLDTLPLLADESLPTVPLLYRGKWHPDWVLPLAEQDSETGGPGHMQEGVVIVPERERCDDEIGRVALKHISNRYWESAA